MFTLLLSLLLRAATAEVHAEPGFPKYRTIKHAELLPFAVSVASCWLLDLTTFFHCDHQRCSLVECVACLHWPLVFYAQHPLWLATQVLLLVQAAWCALV